MLTCQGIRDNTKLLNKDTTNKESIEGSCHYKQTCYLYYTEKHREDITKASFA